MKKILVLTSTFPKDDLDYRPDFVKKISVGISEKFKVFVLTPYIYGSLGFEKLNKNLLVFRFRYWFNFKNLLCDDAIVPKLKQNPFYWFVVPFFLFFQFINIFKLVRKYDIDIIHAHWILPQGLLAVLYKKLLNKKIKILLTCHGADLYSLRKFDFIKKWVLSNCDNVTVVSLDMKNVVKDLVSSVNVEVLPMGVDTDFFKPNLKNSQKNIDKKNINLLFVGRVTEKKGLIYLVKAAQKLRDKFNLKLTIIGSGDKLGEIKSYVKNHNLGNEILFLGGLNQKDIIHYYQNSDIFIGPSIKTGCGDQEGFGLVFAEALACGCPVITTDLLAVSDIVKHLKTGIVVSQKSVSEICDAVDKLVQNDNLYLDLKINSRKFILDNFDTKIIYKKYLNIFERF